jgi:hypothetical protein
MVERFNRRLAEVLSARGNVHPRRKFDTHQQRNAFILRFLDDYKCTRLDAWPIKPRASPC